MTEAEARGLLRAYRGYGMVDRWIAEQPWQAAPDGWTVTGALQGWQFHVEVIPAGLRIRAGEPGAVPAVWIVKG